SIGAQAPLHCARERTIRPQRGRSQRSFPCGGGARAGKIGGSSKHGEPTMCELDDLEEFARRADVSRRQFGAMALGAGIAAALPAMAGAAETKGADVEIKTPDGTCDAYFVSPTKGKHAGVLIWPDIFGLRPTMKQM